MIPSEQSLVSEDTAVPVTMARCRHGRIVDDVLTPEGERTGHLVCKECQAVFPDPLRETTTR